MKNFKVLLLVLAMLNIVSCSKDHINDINENGGKVEVGVGLLVNSNNGLTKSEVQDSEDVARGNTPACVESLTIESSLVDTDGNIINTTEKTFNFPVVPYPGYMQSNEDGEIIVDSELKMLMWPGDNLISVTTTSYVETALTDPRGEEADGISAGNPVDQFITDAINQMDNSLDLTEKYAKALRDIPPYATFHTLHPIAAFITAQSKIQIPLYTDEGRMLVTCEMATDVPDKYTGKFFPTEYKVDGSTYDKEMCPDEEFTTTEPCWYYWSNEDSKVEYDGVEVKRAKVEGFIELYKNGRLVRTINLYEACEKAVALDPKTDINYLDIEGGKDKWLRVIISKDDIKIYFGWWEIIYHWEEEDNTIGTF